jgi:deoxycytidylate deaminase
MVNASAADDAAVPVTSSGDDSTAGPVAAVARHTFMADASPIELVFGLVGPSGVDLSLVASALEAQLKTVKYESCKIPLRKLIIKFGDCNTDSLNEFQINEALIKKGNELCKQTKRKDIVGRLGITAIRGEREKITGDKDKPHPKARVAYIVHSFKRKEEVELYRNIYGKAFTLVSVYASRASRVQALTKRFQGCVTGGGDDHARTPEELALRIIDRDYKEEEEEFGQRVGKVFPLADFFVNSGSRPELERQLLRLVRLTLGDPYISPTRDEQGVFFAQAAALRSLDLSRQVGAAITSIDGDVLATGCNEVPKFGGGLYWGEDAECNRDFELGYDANVRIKTELLADAIGMLREKQLLASGAQESNAQLAKSMLFGRNAFFDKSKLYDVIEFGRAVHAEMDAISQAARIGVALQNSKLFCTTFPCHICARHIVAAGVEPHEPAPRRSNFKAFVGVAPRKYIEMFQATGDRKKEDGSIRDLNAEELRPKFRRFVFTYIQAEILFEQELKQLLGNTED